MTRGGARVTRAFMAAAADLSPEDFAARARGRALLALDLGTKTIGVAAADGLWLTAAPVETIRRTRFRDDAARLLALAAEREAGGIVLGLPLNMDGGEGPRAQATRAFARNLRGVTDLPILFQDERLSTQEAEDELIAAGMRREKRAAVIDQAAAVVILRAALERLRPFLERNGGAA